MQVTFGSFGIIGVEDSVGRILVLPSCTPFIGAGKSKNIRSIGGIEVRIYVIICTIVGSPAPQHPAYPPQLPSVVRIRQNVHFFAVLYGSLRCRPGLEEIEWEPYQGSIVEGKHEECRGEDSNLHVQLDAGS